MPSRKKKLPPFDKYFYYTNSVQGAAFDAELLWKMFHKVSRVSASSPVMLQEDFCGTGALCYEWAALDPRCQAVGIDLDNDALEWGRRVHGSEHDDETISRVGLVCGDVLDDHKVRPNLICALNFSYFFIKDRSKMLDYFRTSRKSLQKDGLLILDCFGGPSYQNANIDKRRNDDENFTYWWEVESFDSITNDSVCHLHYQRPGEKQRKKVFSYFWRIWSVPELTDILKEAGFSSIEYWAEGTNKHGNGDGKFKPVAHEKNCDAWVCYIIAKA